MATILMRDGLRQTVEAASGGKQTVVYTAKGQPSIMNIVEKFDMSAIDSSLSGTHPAFIVNGVEKASIMIGTYEGCVIDGELVSQANVAPTGKLTIVAARTAAKACGAGFHLMTAQEWAAVQLKCDLNLQANDAKYIEGNVFCGRSHGRNGTVTYGRRVDGVNPMLDPLPTTGNLATYTGSGGAEWRHNGRYNGISDLVGNVNTWVEGGRIVDGELQLLAINNDAVTQTFDSSHTSASWKALSATTGELITPNGLGTTPLSVKVAQSGTADYTINAPRGLSFGAMTVSEAANPVLTPALNVLKKLGLFPIFPAKTQGSTYLGLEGGSMLGTYYLSRGGQWTSGINAGIDQIGGSSIDIVNPIFGARPCYIP